MSESSYVETFDDGTGGWYGWISNSGGPKRLEEKDGAVIARSPWWIDYNHAPPGAGYLHMVFCQSTKGPEGEHLFDTAGRSRFISGRHSTNFANARLTLRLKGELHTRGAQLVLLIQGNAGAVTSGWLLSGRPFEVTPDWSEQTVVLEPDQSLWTCLGARHDRTDMYGTVEFDKILRGVNVNMMLILFPLTVEPMGPIDGDPHRLRAGKDYPVWTSRLPEGYVMLDTVRLDYPDRDGPTKA